MSNKIEETCKTLDRSNNGYSVDNIQNPSLIHDSQRKYQNEFPGTFVLGNGKTIIELKVMEKRRKPGRTTVNTFNREHNTKDEQKSNDEHRKNWCQSLQEHTRPIVKENLQNLCLKNHQHNKKISSSSVERKDNKKMSTPQQQQLKYRNSNSANKQSDEVPFRQAPVQKISKEYGKRSQQTGISSGASSNCTKCTKSVLVTDREVQCGGIFDSSYDKFNDLDPIQTLGYLMKQLEHLIQDERSSTILKKMEHVIESERTKFIAMDLALHRRLNEKTTELEKMSKQMKLLREERDLFKRNVEENSKLLEEVLYKQSDLEKQLNEATRTIESKDKLISELREEYKEIEPLQNKLAELRVELNKQTELTRQSNLEVQYLMLKRDKLRVRLSHKDLEVNENHKLLKELQNEIENLIREGRIKEDSNFQGSIIQCGVASSSLSQTSSDRSNIPTPLNDLLDISISAIDDSKNFKKVTSKKDNLLLNQVYRTTEKDMGKTKIEDINESNNNNGSTQLEFVSLPTAESMFPSYKDQERCSDDSDTNKDKNYLFPSKSSIKLSNRVQQFVDVDSSFSSVQDIIEQDNEKVLRKKQLFKNRKTLQFDNKTNNHDNEVIEESSKFIEANVSGDLITSNINEEFRTIFDDVRRKSKIPINVPSPPRCYPRPDWTDSTLSSFSVDSKLNIAETNIT